MILLLIQHHVKVGQVNVEMIIKIAMLFNYAYCSGPCRFCWETVDLTDPNNNDNYKNKLIIYSVHSLKIQVVIKSPVSNNHDCKQLLKTI